MVDTAAFSHAARFHFHGYLIQVSQGRGGFTPHVGESGRLAWLGQTHLLVGEAIREAQNWIERQELSGPTAYDLLMESFS
jgi:hypothetical protein